MLAEQVEIVAIGMERAQAQLASRLPIVLVVVVRRDDGDAIVAEETKKFLATAHQEAYDILEENRDVLDALWDLVWAGEVTNDTLAPLRSYLRGAPREDRRVPHLGRPFRSRRIGPPGSEGRWSLLPEPGGTPTERSAALAQTLLLVTLNANGLIWARHLIHDPGGMVVKNFAFLVLVWVAAGLSRATP